jgi:hypothetical protein
VVSCINSFASIFSTWLDFKMKDLLPYVKSYTKNSFSILEDIKNITLPPGALLFTADATSMYTNITTHVSVHNVKQLMDLHLPANYPKELVLDIIHHEQQYLHVWRYLLAANIRHRHGYAGSLLLRNHVIWQT